MDETFKQHVLDKIVLGYAKNSLRTILTAYSEVEIDSRINIDLDTWSEEDMMKDLTMIGITGIKDPLRPEIVGAIQKCKSAGITVRMVTGDNFNTAIAISKECGILPSDYEPRQGSYEAMEGKTFREMVG
jgi:P-type Ca2+ transporter type 2B